MLEATVSPPGQKNEMLVQSVLEQRESSLPPAVLPRWVFLQWLARQGWLLHGAQRGGLNKLRPSTVDYHRPDDFSNTRGVYAASDGR